MPSHNRVWIGVDSLVGSQGPAVAKVEDRDRSIHAWQRRPLVRNSTAPDFCHFNTKHRFIPYFFVFPPYFVLYFSLRSIFSPCSLVFCSEEWWSLWIQHHYRNAWNSKEFLTGFPRKIRLIIERAWFIERSATGTFGNSIRHLVLGIDLDKSFRFYLLKITQDFGAFQTYNIAVIYRRKAFVTLHSNTNIQYRININIWIFHWLLCFSDSRTLFTLLNFGDILYFLYLECAF